MESGKLEELIQNHMQRLHRLPAYINPPPPERVLKNLPWLQGNHSAMDLIKVSAAESNMRPMDVRTMSVCAQMGRLKTAGSIDCM